METELVRDDEGHIVGEIHHEGDTWQVWRREPPSFPPSPRNVLVGEAHSLEAARQLAETLRRRS